MRYPSFAPMLRVSLGAVLLGLAVASPARAQRLYRFEVGAYGIYNIYDSQLELASTFGGGGSLGYWITGPLSVEVEGTFAKPTTDTPLKESVTATTFGGAALANFGRTDKVSFFLKAGYAQVNYGTCPDVSVPGAGPCGSAGMLQGGIGTRIALTPIVMMRYQAMLSQSLTTLKFTNISLHAGVSVMIGSKPLVDSDGDRVYDRYDDCPATRLGALVNKHGCPTDRDGDSVPDGLDRCPGTPDGATVDEVGCSRDSDADGFLDGLDECPDTPRGALVDERGCQHDADTDGVFDGLDRCPDTPVGAKIDGLGCPEDADADGVFDGLDQCPDSRRDTPVDARGCVAGPVLADTEAGLKWMIPGAVWQTRGAVLGEAAFPILDSVAAALKAKPRTQAEVNGFAHDRLVPSDNTRLSQRRAETVRSYLVSKGIAPSRIAAVGRGSLTLLVADTTDAARTANRRVEIRVFEGP